MRDLLLEMRRDVKLPNDFLCLKIGVFFESGGD
jgi:hypothetical protein